MNNFHDSCRIRERYWAIGEQPDGQGDSEHRDGVLRSSLDRARTEAAAAASASAGTGDLERALIGALAYRYPSQPEAPDEDDFRRWNNAYADAMREVHRSHRGDLDVCSLFAEAIMNRTPWELWDLAPDAGHLVHMPTHIDVLCGHYHNVVTRNSAAIVADRKYLDLKGPMNFYSAYRCHDYHFKVYGAMLAGQYTPALEAAEEMNRTLPEELLRTGSPPMADWLEGFVAIKQHVFVRFGKWHEILDQHLPFDQQFYCVTTAMMRYARTVCTNVLFAAAKRWRNR